MWVECKMKFKKQNKKRNWNSAHKDHLLFGVDIDMGGGLQINKNLNVQIFQEILQCREQVAKKKKQCGIYHLFLIPKPFQVLAHKRSFSLVAKRHCGKCQDNGNSRKI